MIRKVRMLVSALVLAGALWTPTGAAAQVNRELWFRNECRHPVRLFVYHEHGDGSWVTHGWYEFAGNEGPMRPTQGSRPLVHIEGRPLFMYVESTNGSRQYWEGAQRVMFNGQEYALMRATLSVRQGQLSFGVNCNGQ
ncbi:MAG: hypothetical protein AB7O91_00850 [Sphingomonas sp.]